MFCREQQLVYLAVHNHGGTDRVGFSRVDLASHERGYPTLLDLTQGVPVGALVFANVRRRDVWWTSAHRTKVEEVRVIGHTIERLTPEPRHPIEPVPTTPTTAKSSCSARWGRHDLRTPSLVSLGRVGQDLC